MMAPVAGEDRLACAGRRCALLHFYWETAIQDLRLTFGMLKQIEDGGAQFDLARMVADEANHLWLLSKRIVDLGCTPMPDSVAHRMRRARMVRIPKNAGELLALAVAAKERAFKRYTIECCAGAPPLTELTQKIADDHRLHLAALRVMLARLGGAPQPSDRTEGYLSAEDALYTAFTTVQPHSP